MTAPTVIIEGPVVADYDGEWWRAAAPDIRASIGGRDVAVALCSWPLSLRPWVFVGLVTRRDMRAPGGHAAALEALKAFAEEEFAATEDYLESQSAYLNE